MNFAERLLGVKVVLPIERSPSVSISHAWLKKNIGDIPQGSERAASVLLTEFA